MKNYRQSGVNKGLNGKYGWRRNYNFIPVLTRRRDN
jgi:hypothetical protein